MKTATFITDIVCELCVAEVSTALAQIYWIDTFEFDVSQGRNYLKVSFNDAYSTAEVIMVIQQLGYIAKERKSLLRFFGL